jgi:hypothetical protein
MAPPTSAPRTPRRGRRAGIPIAVTFSPEALALLRLYAPPVTRGLGDFLSRLLYEHHARVEERRRILDEQRLAANGKEASGG